MSAWTTCSAGHDHFGGRGAAGLLIADGDDVLLVQRAHGTDKGGTWSIPGGALDTGECAHDAALREAREELSLPPSCVRVFAEHVADCGGWTFTTLLAELDPMPDRLVLDWEIDAVEWVPADRVTRGRPLHPGLRAAWPHLRALLEPEPAPTAGDLSIPSEIHPGLWLAGSRWPYPHDLDLDLLVTLCEPHEIAHTPAARRERVLPMVDATTMGATPRQIRMLALDVAEAVAAGQRVMVRCHWGVERSGMVAALAVRLLTGDPFPVVLARMRECRSRHVLHNPSSPAWRIARGRLPEHPDSLKAGCR